jgi:hypothetical protein
MKGETKMRNRATRIAREIQKCIDAARAQGYIGARREYILTEEDEDAIEHAIGVYPTPEEWSEAWRIFRVDLNR